MPSTEIQMLLGEIGSELLQANHTLDRVVEEQRLTNYILAETHQVQVQQAQAFMGAIMPQQTPQAAVAGNVAAGMSQQQPTVPGQLAAQQSAAAMQSGGLQGAQKHLDEFRAGLDLVPGQFRSIATASRTTATIIKTALISTGVGAFVVALGVALGAVTALIGGAVKLGADFKRTDADIQSTGLSLLEIERSARYASFAFADLDDARAVTMRLADSAREAQYQLQNFGQIDTQQIVAATRLGLGYFETIRAGQQGLDAAAERLRGLGGDVDVRLIRDAFKVSLEDAEYLKVLADGTDEQIAQAEKQREEARVIGEREREAAKTQHTTIQNMGADIRQRLIPAVEKLIEISGGILHGIEAVASKIVPGFETREQIQAREQAARRNLAIAQGTGAGAPTTAGYDFVADPGRQTTEGAQTPLERETERLREQQITLTDITKSIILNDQSGIVRAVESRLERPGVADEDQPWYVRPATDVAREWGRTFWDELRTLPAPWESQPYTLRGGAVSGGGQANDGAPVAQPTLRTAPVTFNNTYNITGGMRELDETRRVSDEANMRVVRELAP